MHRWRTVLAGILLSILTLACGGCLAVVAAAGTDAGVAYAKGDLETVEEATPPQVITAAESALQEMGLSVLAANSNELQGTVNARTAQDKKITITAVRQTETTSQLSIRVGAFGHQAMSQAIYEKIKARL